MRKKRKQECKQCGHKIPWVLFSDYVRDRSDKIYITSKNHPDLMKASELVEQARELELRVREEQRDARQSLKAVYQHTVQVKEASAHTAAWSKIEEGQEYIVITSHLTNDSDFRKHFETYGSMTNGPDLERRSVKYYRKHGLLFADGGGHVPLTFEEPCSDEEWEDLKAGNIPEKFLGRR